ncbi:glycosyltransferase [Methylobacterium dankookense]|uniref:D-inositol-3-phosphate glycosyltransferase n=1 Tax=Methylobacterium dankookense TaxID=560405 RepID=A0A564G773_9HYPH|nr:glycosyltransferase [Methylobacterium dankookense]GJD56243.1 D-inositol-3-phosphate glycosyltransferase [Methylobacterium dankookense]VUF15922.1 Putative glycosyltransferase EpsF [Methylobacterium dankookense]
MRSAAIHEPPVPWKAGGAAPGGALRAAPQPVAVMIGQLAQGGSERQLYLFLAHCDRSRWAPTLYVSGTLGIWEAPIRALGVPIVLLTGNPAAKLLRLRAAVRRQRPGAFFSWSSYTNVFALALLGLGVHRVGSYRNSLFADLPRRGRSAWAWASRAALSTVVCNSRETLEAFPAGAHPARRAVYVPNGVDPIPAEQAQAWRASWRARLGIAPDQILVVGVGRLTPQKCFSRFIEVVAGVSRSVPVQAVIAGDDLGCRGALEAAAQRQGLGASLRLIGSVPDARALICAADIFLLTSDHEGMPNVVLEAMAAGVPCVSTPVNAVGDILRHGETGLLGSFDAHDLAGCVEVLARNPALRRRMGTAARAHVEREHDPARLAQALWRLCEPEAAHPAR